MSLKSDTLIDSSTLRPRPHVSRYTETAYLIFASGNKNLVWCHPPIHTNNYTILLFTFDNYYLAGMRRPCRRFDFAAFFNVTVALSSTMARPACTLTHQALVRAGRTQNRFYLMRFRTMTFCTPSSRT